MRRKKIEHLSHVLCVFSQFFLLAIELRRICCFCLLKILISHLNAMNCSVYVYTYTIYVSMQLAAYLCVCVCVFMVILCLVCCPFRLMYVVICLFVLAPLISPLHLTASHPNRTEPNRSDPIQSDPAQLSSAQLTVNSNAIIYTIHLHCPADRL